MEQVKNKKIRELSYFALVSVFAGLIAGCLMVNLILGDTIIQNVDTYNFITLIQKAGQLNRNELLVFLLCKRGELFVVFLLCVFACPNKLIRPCCLFVLSAAFGILLTTQIICNGIVGIYECLLFLFPHMIVYVLGLFLIVGQYLHRNYMLMLLFLFSSLLLGILLESYVNPLLITVFF